jgi:hypothetical protein
MGEREKATVTVKVTPSTHQNIRRLAAELRMRNAEAIEHAVGRMLEDLAKKGKG